jgi:hypothetical protein
MKRVPHAQSVRHALREVQTTAKKALKGLNQVASQRMAKGDYMTAERLAVKGKEIQQFQSEVDTIVKHWREICGGMDRKAKKSATPLWNYYQPILQALVTLGGTAHRRDLEGQLEHLIAPTLLAEDRVLMAGGRERWRVMVQRARKSMVGEGWVANGVGPTWRITESGRHAAQRSFIADSQGKAETN